MLRAALLLAAAAACLAPCRGISTNGEVQVEDGKLSMIIAGARLTLEATSCSLPTTSEDMATEAYVNAAIATAATATNQRVDSIKDVIAYFAANQTTLMHELASDLSGRMTDVERDVSELRGELRSSVNTTMLLQAAISSSVALSKAEGVDGRLDAHLENHVTRTEFDQLKATMDKFFACRAAGREFNATSGACLSPADAHTGVPCTKETLGAVKFDESLGVLLVCIETSTGYDFLSVSDAGPLTLGTTSSEPAASCKAIIEAAGTRAEELTNGEYWVSLSGTATKVFCDMKSDGGGWTLISHVVSDGNAVSYSLSNDLSALSSYASAKMGLSSTGLRNLRGAGTGGTYFSELRWRCRKGHHGRTLDIATKPTASSVYEFMAANTNTFPKACANIRVLPDDSSILSQRCARWGHDGSGYFTDTFGHTGMFGEDRLYNHAMFVCNCDSQGGAHWLSHPGTTRWECDDNVNSLQAGDYWDVFVR